tara:strand:- start:26758 stop:27153 length:396 start_codon:yes stop_codon:yes gene_type:complete
VSKGSKQRPTNSEAFSDNFDKIFGDRDIPKTGTYVQTENGFVPREDYVRPDSVNAPSIMKPLEAFKSPIDGSIISDRGKLAAHNKRHGVTNSADYSNNYLERKTQQRVASGDRYLKQTRFEDISRAIESHS